MSGDGQRAVELYPAAHGEGLTALVLLGSADGVRILLAQLGQCRRGDEVAFVELGCEAHDLVLALTTLLLAENQSLEDLNLLQGRWIRVFQFQLGLSPCSPEPRILHSHCESR